MSRTTLAVFALVLTAWATPSHARPAEQPAPDKRVTVVGRAAGTGESATDLAIADARRRAVEEACGVFLTAQSTSRNYKNVYDKVLANTVGYIKESEVVRIWTAGDVTLAEVRALVSTQKFESEWASIAHTLRQENNPRVMVVVAESVHQDVDGATFEIKETGIVQGKVESFLLSKGVILADKRISDKLTERDVMLAAVKDDTAQLAALGARFQADVVLVGRATAKYGKTIEVAGQQMHQYTATLSVRVVQTDSGQVLASMSFDPVTINTMQRGGGEDKALTKLADAYAPKILAEVAEAWRTRVNVARMLSLSIVGMDYEAFKAFRDELEQTRGVRDVNLREITEGLASIDLQYEFGNEQLADTLTALRNTRLSIVEFNASRLKLRLLSPGTGDASETGAPVENQ